VSVRRVVLVTVLAAALVVAGGAFLSAGVRLAQSPRDAKAAPVASPAPALRVFDRRQTAQESADAAYIPGLDDLEEITVRRIGTPDGLVVLGWRDGLGDVCESAYRPGPSPLAEVSCAKVADFTDGGVSIRWPDSPDLGPFDIRWTPDGRLELTSARPPGGIPVTPRATPSRSR
jgi:hypothetical protein